MFGIMDLSDGQIIESNVTVPNLFTRRQKNRTIFVAFPKDYINKWQSGYKCEHEGCFKDVCVECHVPGDDCEFLDRDEKFITAQCIHFLRSEHGDQPCEDVEEPWNCEYYKKHNMVEHFCPDHAFKAGYCVCCGEFWGGIEDFDFGNGLCDNCKDAIDCDKTEYWTMKKSSKYGFTFGVMNATRK